MILEGARNSFCGWIGKAPFPLDSESGKRTPLLGSQAALLHPPSTSAFTHSLNKPVQ